MSTMKQIKKYIEHSAVEEFFDTEMETDMALEFLSIKNDYTSTLKDDVRIVKEYRERKHSYSFCNTTAEAFFPMINKFLMNYHGWDMEGDLVEYLRCQTTLNDLNICKVIGRWLAKL